MVDLVKVTKEKGVDILIFNDNKHEEVKALEEKLIQTKID